MASLVPGYQYDIFISYRHNDNRSGASAGSGQGWVTEFVSALQEELAATIKEPISIYFDKNPHDGLLETHSVDKSLEGKLKCLIFIPIISQTYCDPKSFAWQHEFCAFNGLAKEDPFGRDVKLSNGNVASRILPIKIHDLDADDKAVLESEIGGVLRAVEFIFRSAGVNRPLNSSDKREENLNKTLYRDQVNKVANAIKETVTALRNPTQTSVRPSSTQSPSPSAQPGRNRWKVIGAMLLLALAATAGYYFYGQRTTNNEQRIIDKSIAVLPFDDFMEEEGMKYFADGLTEEILNALAKTPDLKVASRTSSFQYKDKNDDARKIASELGVAHILEGSVRGSGDRLRITVQLIRASDGFHLWSENYDKKKDDIIQIQEDIALKIAQALQTAMDPEALKDMVQSGTKNMEAYAYYLKGLSGIDSYENFERAREVDSTFAKAHFSAALFWDTQLRLVWLEGSETTKSYSEKIDLFNQRIEKAIQYALPLDKIAYQAEQAVVNLELRKALNLNRSYIKERPNDIGALFRLVTVCAYLGEFELAEQFMEALEISSLHNGDDYGLVVAFYANSWQFARGSAFAKKALVEFPNSGRLLTQAHRVFQWSGMMKEAREAYDAYMELGDTGSDQISLLVEFRQACADGNAELANSIFETFFEGSYTWYALTLLNRKEEARQYVQKLSDNNEMYSLVALLSQPMFDVKQVPKLQAILDRENAKPREFIEYPFTLKTKVEK